MKKSWQVLMIVAALGSVLSCATTAFAQRVPIAGGYAGTSTTSPEVVSAARYAAREQALKDHVIIFVDSIKSAEVQVVAGLNYRLGMRVVVYDKPQDVRAVVYKNLDQEYSLSSWEVVGRPASDSVGLPSLYSDSAIEQLMKALDEAYSTGKMGRLDARRPYLGRVRFVIEHSIGGDGGPDSFERRQFRTLAQAERWLKSRQREDGTPFRETRPLEECSGGMCTYDFNGGILHNHLYLQKVSYGFSKGRPYIKTIYLLDGD
ncbi:MAG TPA: hypothetical protein VIW80_18080 [Pyrinomonadaceae bacterium]|jgi:hypothetical protein